MCGLLWGTLRLLLEKKSALSTGPLNQRYGKVFTLWLGPLPTVHIADFTLSYEAMVRYGAKYQDRWSPAIMLEGRGDRGLIVSSGELWQEQRRFSLHTLRNLGLSGNLVEERIMEEFNRRYGKVFTLWLGPLPTVHIADFTLSYEAMVRYGAKYQDRWSPAMMLEGRGDRGLIVSSGELWQEQRRFSLHTLRNLGLSGNLVEERIMEEFNRRFDEIDQLPSNSTIDPFVLFGHLVGGVINRMLFGEPVDEVLITLSPASLGLRNRLHVLHGAHIASYPQKRENPRPLDDSAHGNPV
ncbi:hypothetical protein DICVIV_12259 [Dictyocaulus viviparus]|uniref:Unspecific monooxygenase n=1 Tax=Dictyocaulus viviparus TaxID=29172 RepID=A0A0D8XDP6_DICVI|nr:hypothetical protein DICVIV_12259 [Dictyocaulus viviparus]